MMNIVIILKRVTVVHSTTIYITSNDRASSLMSDHILFCVEDDHYFVILRTTIKHNNKIINNKI